MIKVKQLLDGQEKIKLAHLLEKEIASLTFDDMACAYYHLNTIGINQKAVDMTNFFDRVEAFCIEMRTRLKDIEL